jgi:hypothetical protein
MYTYNIVGRTSALNRISIQELLKILEVINRLKDDEPIDDIYLLAGLNLVRKCNHLRESEVWQIASKKKHNLQLT